MIDFAMPTKKLNAIASPASPRTKVLNLPRYATYFLHLVSNKMSSGASRLYLSRFDIGVIEWRVIGMVAVEPGITSNRICEMIGFDKAAISRATRTLESKGYLKLISAPDDLRRRTLELTTRGLKLHDRILAIALERERRLLSGLSEQEVDILLDLLARMAKNLPYVNEYEPETGTTKPRSGQAAGNSKEDPRPSPSRKSKAGR
jgi:DNA-binding MarR family transcriptional regulator